MSGYGPPRGWRGSNAWGAAPSQPSDTAADTTPQDPAVLLRNLLKREPGVFTRAEEDALRIVLDERDQLRPEYGIRSEWINGLSSEGSVADTLDGALRALEEFDARHGDRIVSRELVVRPVGKWRQLDAEQQPEDGDRG